MKPKNLIAGLATILVCLLSCSKLGRDAVSQNQLVAKMSSDEDVQLYFVVMKKQTTELTVPFTSTLGDSTKQQQKPSIEAITKILAAHPEQTKFLLDQALKIRERYNLQRYNEAEIKIIFDKVLTAIETNPELKNKKLQSRSQGDKNATMAKGNGNVSFPVLRVADGDTGTICTDWYVMQYDAWGNPLYQTYAYSECVPGNTGGGYGYPTGYDMGGTAQAEADSIKLLEDYCAQDRDTKINRCNRETQIQLAIIMIGGVAGIALSAGVLTGPALYSFMALTTAAATRNYFCIADAWTDYNTCMERAKKPKS